MANLLADVANIIGMGQKAYETEAVTRPAQEQQLQKGQYELMRLGKLEEARQAALSGEQGGLRQFALEGGDVSGLAAVQEMQQEQREEEAAYMAKAAKRVLAAKTPWEKKRLWKAERARAGAMGFDVTDDPEEYDDSLEGHLQMLAESAPTLDIDELPAPAKTWEYAQRLPEDQRAQFMEMVGGQKIEKVDTGKDILLVNKRTGEVLSSTPKELAPKDRPTYLTEAERAKGLGKQVADVQTQLASFEAKMPELESTVELLGELAKKATYTTAGRTWNEIRKETGQMPTEGAKARKEYESVVNNQILPLLKDTFGAAFTVAEGDALRATLGDVNATPEEKQVVIDSFIRQKKMTLESKKREYDILHSFKGRKEAVEEVLEEGAEEDTRDISEYSEEELRAIAGE